MYVANTAEARAELDARYNLTKKENLINIQKLDIANKNSLLYGSLFLKTIISIEKVPSS